MSRSPLAILLVFPLAGCPFGAKDPDETGGESGGGGSSTYEQFCDALDECNLLKGQSASECATYFESCTDELLASEAGDVESATEECLAETSSCDALYSCYWHDIPYC